MKTQCMLKPTVPRLEQRAVRDELARRMLALHEQFQPRAAVAGMIQEPGVTYKEGKLI